MVKYQTRRVSKARCPSGPWAHKGRPVPSFGRPNRRICYRYIRGGRGCLAGWQNGPGDGPAVCTAGFLIWSRGYCVEQGPESFALCSLAGWHWGQDKADNSRGRPMGILDAGKMCAQRRPPFPRSPLRLTATSRIQSPYLHVSSIVIPIPDVEGCRQLARAGGLAWLI